MSETQYAKFMGKVRDDREMRKKLREAKVSAIIAFAKSYGFEVQPSDLAKDRQSKS
jgi:predicted ribosomally synthesized peptide with nif11-like leader